MLHAQDRPSRCAILVSHAAIMALAVFVGFVGSRPAQCSSPTDRCKLSIVPLPARDTSDLNEWGAAIAEAKSLNVDLVHSYIQWGAVEWTAGHYDWNGPGDYMALAAASGVEVSQEIEIICVDQMGAVPADLAGRSLSDPYLQQRFLDFVEAYCRHFADDVSYLWLGNEIDTYLHYRPYEVDTWADLLSRAVDIVHREAPNMKVGTVMTYQGALMFERTDWIHTFGPLVDVMGVTFYPQHLPGRYDEATIDQYFDDMIATYGDYPLAIVESSVSANPIYSGGEANQISYCHALFRALRRHKDKLEFGGWFNLHDFDPAYLAAMFGDWQDGLDFNGTLALSTFYDQPRPVYYVFADEAVSSPPEDMPPTVSWAHPSDGDDVTGWRTLRIDAADEEDDTEDLTVHLRIDGGWWIAVNYNAQTGLFERGWNTAVFGAGPHSLHARVQDRQGQIAVASIDVTTIGADGPPTVAWETPEDGHLVTGVAGIALVAADDRDSGNALIVQWRVDDGDWRDAFYDPGTERYRNSWYTGGMADGDYPLDARAIDTQGHVSDMATIAVHVANGAGDPNAMYVWEVSHWTWWGSRSLITVTVRRDSDADRTPEESDQAVAGAALSVRVTHDSDGDGVFEPGGDDQYWDFTRTTSGEQWTVFALEGPPAGAYRVDVTGLTHDYYVYEPTLNVDVPFFYTR